MTKRGIGYVQRMLSDVEINPTGKRTDVPNERSSIKYGKSTSFATLFSSSSLL